MKLGNIENMELIGFLIWTAIIGLVIGALGRSSCPGPNYMGVGMTILVGVGGALLGGFVGTALGAGDGIRFILAVAAAALIVYFMQRRPTRVY